MNFQHNGLNTSSLFPAVTVRHCCGVFSNREHVSLKGMENQALEIRKSEECYQLNARLSLYLDTETHFFKPFKYRFMNNGYMFCSLVRFSYVIVLYFYVTHITNPEI